MTTPGHPPATVIVGGGSAGASAATALRATGHDEPITLIGSEEYPPYRRPIVSKEALTAHRDVGESLIKPHEFWDQHRIELRTGVSVTDGNTADRVVALSSGEELGYESLILAVGAAARRLPGVDPGPRVRYLRSYDDARQLRGVLADSDSVVIVGAGLIGSEVASSAVAMGVSATVLDPAPWPSARVFPQIVGERMAELQRAAGVDLRLGTPPGRVSVTETSVDVSAGADVVSADLLVVAIGAEPATELAQRLGLQCADGVVVDANYCTDVAGIYAIGDCASLPGPWGRYRTENISAATEHGVGVARVLAGERAPEVVPWGWTTQFETTVQFAGWPHAEDEFVVEGDVSGTFLLRCLRDGVLSGAVAVGRPRELRALRAELAISSRQLREHTGQVRSVP